MQQGLRALLIHKGTKRSDFMIGYAAGLRALLIHKGTKHEQLEKFID